MGRRTIAEVSQHTLKLQAYLEKQKPGSEISYQKIDHDTGVKMNQRGKQYLRSALHRAKLEHSCMHGYGIKLADPETTMPIMTHKLMKIDRAVRRADRSHRNLQEQFFMSLSEQEQRELLMIGSVFGAIRVAAENGKAIYLRQSAKRISAQEAIQIPKGRA